MITLIITIVVMIIVTIIITIVVIIITIAEQSTPSTSNSLVTKQAVHPISLLISFLLRFVASRFPGNSLWT